MLALLATTALAQTPVPCESYGGYRECQIAMSGRIRLVMEMSDSMCREAISWGTVSDGTVWVDRGCRAMFVADTPRRTGPERVVCESHNGRRETCEANTRRGIDVARQLSHTECVEGLNWDHTAGSVWVDDDCRAEFLLGPRAPVPPQIPKLERRIVCESVNDKRQHCAADTAEGAQLVRQLSEEKCNFGREWGWDRNGVWVNKGCRAEFAVRGKPRPVVQTVTCESKDNQRRHCMADTELGVAVLREGGGTPCILDKTWGFDDIGVWVDHGCSGQFVLGGYRLPEEPPSSTKLLCESVDGKRTLCRIDTRRGVGLLRQISDAPCVLNRTWGYDLVAIWVSAGCRAEFAVGQ